MFHNSTLTKIANKYHSLALFIEVMDIENLSHCQAVRTDLLLNQISIISLPNAHRNKKKHRLSNKYPNPQHSYDHGYE